MSNSTTSMTRYLRTTIVLSENAIDVQLPADSSVEDVIFELVRYLNEALNKQGYDTDWLLDADAVWTLELFGRRQLDNEQTLAEQGVMDGTRLWLSKNAKNETYPALIDDIAESVAEGQEQFPKWTYAVDAVKFSAFLLGGLGIFGALLATYLACWGLPTDNSARYPLVGVMAGLMVLTSALSVPLVRGGSLLLGTAMLSIGYVSAGSLAFIAIPREPGLWHLSTAGSVLLVYAVIMMGLTPGPTKLHAGIISGAGVVTIISLINYFYTVSPAVIAIEIATLAYFIVLMSSKISMAAGKVETPYVPAAGEALTNDEATIGDVNRSATSAEVIESVVNQKEQSYAAHQYLLGLLIGNLTTITAAMWFAGTHMEDRPISVFFATLNERWLVCMFALSVAAALLNRARNHIDRDVHFILLTSAVVIPAVYLGGLVFSGVRDNMPQIIATVAVVTAASIIGGLWTLGQRAIKSPTVRRYFELLEYAVYAMPILWLGWLLDVYMIVRNR